MIHTRVCVCVCVCVRARACVREFFTDVQGFIFMFNLLFSIVKLC